MGEPVVVKENPSSNPGVVRFVTDRLLTGMGHERYRVEDEVWGERPPDVLARRLFARGGIDGVQVHGNMVTVDLEKGHDTNGLLSIIENMYVHYPENQVGDAALAIEEAPAGAAPAVDDAAATDSEPATAESDPDAG